MIGAALLALLPALAGAAPERMGLAVGSNDGGPDRSALWYAERDAKRVAATLLDVGGFAPGTVELLAGPTVDQVRTALTALARRAAAVAEEGRTPLVLFYFSGHADPLGLKIGGARLPYTELSALLASLPGGVRIAVLDACNSGSLTQEKGASPAALDFELPRAGPADGVAILTSASAGEPAQESAAIGGSFFTHHLTLGLRGPADGDGDGRVTLGEAFRYAYQRTLSATAAAGISPQHPTYAMRVTGQEEVVLSDLREARSALAFPGGAARRFVVSRSGSGELLAEIEAGARPIRVALPPGRYRLERTAPTPGLGGWIEVPTAGVTAVDEGSLTRIHALLARAKGLEPGFRAYANVFAGSAVLRQFGPAMGVGLGLRGSFGWLSLRAGGAYEEKSVDDDGVRYDYRAVGLGSAVGFEASLSRLALQAGLQGTLTFAEQRFASGATAQGALVGLGPYVAAVWPLAPAWAVRLDLEGSTTRFRLNGAPELRVGGRLSAALERSF